MRSELNDCQSLFSQWNENRDGFCEQLTKDSSNCECEKQSVSEYSPGKVSADEVLSRAIYSPIHIDEKTGCVVEAAFSDVKDKGLSVHRLSHVTSVGLVRKGRKKAEEDQDKGKDRQYLGEIRANVDSIKSIFDGHDRRAFCIYDTAQKDDRSHADVCQILIGSKTQLKQARRALQKAFTARPEVPEIEIKETELNSPSFCEQKEQKLDGKWLFIKKCFPELLCKYVMDLPFFREFLK